MTNNPLQIFSLVERLRNLKGSGMFYESIQYALTSNSNYYDVIQFVKDKAHECYCETKKVIPVDLLDEIVAFKMPKYKKLC